MIDLPKTADVVVVGGGCTGTSVAYHLAKMGAQVVLLEKDALASGSTGRAAGLITRQFGTEMHIRLAMESVRFFEELAAEEEFGLRFHQNGYLHLLFTTAQLAEAQRQVALQCHLGVDSRVLSAGDVYHLLPGLKVDDVVGASFCPTDGYTDPYLATNTFAELARRQGAVVSQWTEVTSVKVDQGRVTGVETPRGSISSSVVVDAAGPWAALVAETAGIYLPVRPFKRQLWFTRPFTPLDPTAPILFDTHHDFYFRREGAGVIMCLGNPDEPCSFDDGLEWGFASKVAEYATYRFPPFEEAKLVSGWAAPRDITPDHDSILGEIPGVEGFVAAAGHSGHGFMLSPAIGRSVAEIITQGTSSIDISSLSINRFGGRRFPLSAYSPTGV